MLEPRNYYRVENMVRSQSSRVQRQASLTRHKAALWILGRRVLPGQPLLLPPQEYAEYKTALLTRVQMGEISIVRPDQVRIDSTSNGVLIYYPPNKPATFIEPAMDDSAKAEVAVEPVEDAVVETELATELESAPPVLDETPTPEMLEGGEVIETVSPEVETSKLPETVSEPEGPRLCVICREELAQEGTSTCSRCAAPVIETKPIELDTTPQEETPPEVVEEPESPVVQSRKSKKKGKSHD